MFVSRYKSRPEIKDIVDRQRVKQHPPRPQIAAQLLSKKGTEPPGPYYKDAPRGSQNDKYPPPSRERPYEARKSRPEEYYDKNRDVKPREDRPKDERVRDPRSKEDNRLRDDQPRDVRQRDVRPRDDRPRDDRPKDDRPKDDKLREYPQKFPDSNYNRYGDGNRQNFDRNGGNKYQNDEQREDRLVIQFLSKKVIHNIF